MITIPHARNRAGWYPPTQDKTERLDASKVAKNGMHKNGKREIPPQYIMMLHSTRKKKHSTQKKVLTRGEPCALMQFVRRGKPCQTR